MFSDALFGSAYLVAGIYNLSVYYHEQYFPWQTRFYCFFRPHVQLFIIVTPAVGLISLATSIDRLLSVFKPVQYFHWSRKYAYFMGFLAFAGVIPVYIISLIGAYETRDTFVNGLCLLQYALVPVMYSSMRMVRICSSIIGALLYVPILFKLKQIITATNNFLSDSQKKGLTRTTMTILLITLNEIILFTIPDIYVIINTVPNNLLFFLMNLNKGVINMIVFLWTQQELRKCALFWRLKNHSLASRSNGHRVVPKVITVSRT
uniref:G-protein coupled receptors family 1 profile domain-containing protein n=1 Tax=Panagrolaimus sp. JU765 TaxID=591449 RepID=A0AC34QJ44_9BILA